MRLISCLLLVLIAGCEHSDQERYRQYAEIGFESYQRGDYDGASLSFQAALALRPNDPHLLYNLGKCYEHDVDKAKAEEIFQACLAQDANHAQCRHALVLLWWNSGKRKEASEMIQNWLSEQPRLSAAYAEEGWRLSQENDLPNAQARLQQSLRLDPRNELALMELGLLYEKMSMPERSIVLYERILEQDPRRQDVIDRINSLRAKGVGRPLPD
jgi:tetratricopeptide (TPR) repeat protein